MVSVTEKITGLVKQGDIYQYQHQEPDGLLKEQTMTTLLATDAGADALRESGVECQPSRLRRHAHRVDTDSLKNALGGDNDMEQALSGIQTQVQTTTENTKQIVGRGVRALGAAFGQLGSTHEGNVR